MAVMARDAWTDERLDDLNKRVDEGFNEMREEFRATRQEMQIEFGAIRTEIKSEIGGLRGEVAAMQRSFNQIFAGLIGTMFVGFLGVIAAIVTQT